MFHAGVVVDMAGAFKVCIALALFARVASVDVFAHLVGSWTFIA